MNCAVWVLSSLLLSSALPVTSVHHSRHVVERKEAPPAEPSLPDTVYGDAANAAPPESSAVVTVLAEDRHTSAAGMPETVYGDAEPRQVIEVAATNPNETALPVTAYAGGAEIAAEACRRRSMPVDGSLAPRMRRNSRPMKLTENLARRCRAVPG